MNIYISGNENLHRVWTNRLAIQSIDKVANVQTQFILNILTLVFKLASALASNNTLTTSQ